ncbi:hypothetical protein M011DRAFT_308919 [Sporormia fimetaria CBS 119925]|uniref:Uncharacterized protein n=1 Tax=Sporormia fimetaria CBS 119925 TaxID=1340428 RepID=A0A6A6VFT8_9PLEO|nr:hypothetical protein M011DRAFT_308919 [Sporormia fimetaria CBS 119925]
MSSLHGSTPRPRVSPCPRPAPSSPAPPPPPPPRMSSLRTRAPGRSPFPFRNKLTHFQHRLCGCYGKTPSRRWDILFVQMVMEECRCGFRCGFFWSWE